MGGAGAAVGWLAATFGILAVVVVVGLATPEEAGRAELLRKLLVALLVLFPYFLFRFAMALRPVAGVVATSAGALTAACVLASLVVPSAPDDTNLEASMALFIALVLTQWTLLSSFTAVRLWRMGSGQPAVARRRMRLLSLASGLLNVALILAGVTSAAESEVPALFIQLIVAASALSFFAGFAPPKVLRVLWRREEQEELRRATVKLMVATSAAEVTISILPHMSAIVGGRASALLDHHNEVFDDHAVTDEMRSEIPDILEGGPSAGTGFAQDVIVLDVSFGKLVVWGAPATPVFGQDEIEFLHTLAALTGVALERTELFQRERKGRRSLEKSNRELESATAELEQEIAERRRAEEDLIESQMQLAEAQELTMLGSWSWDVEKDRFNWSDQMFKIYGKDSTDFEADLEGFVALVHPDDRVKLRAVVDKLLGTDDSFTMDHRVVRPDGKVRVLHARGKVMRNVSGRALRVIGTTQDITRRQFAEKALHESEARFRTLAESASEGIISIDSRGTIVFWNRGAQDIFGYWEDEVRDQPVRMLMPERYRNDHQRGLTRFLDTGESRLIGSTSVEVEGLRKDGSEFPLELSLSTWTADDRRFFTGILRDISDRKAAELELARANRRQQLILNAAGEGICSLDRDGIIRLMNPAAARMLGYEVDELVGRPQHRMIHHSRFDGSSYPPEECPILNAMLSESVARVGDEVFWRKDGSAVAVEYVVSPITEDDNVTGGVVVFRERLPSGEGEDVSPGRARLGAHPVH